MKRALPVLAGILGYVFIVSATAAVAGGNNNGHHNVLNGIE